MRRAKTYSVFSSQSGGTGKLPYSRLGYSRKGFWKANRASEAPRVIHPSLLKRMCRSLMATEHSTCRWAFVSVGEGALDDEYSATQQQQPGGRFGSAASDRH